MWRGPKFIYLDRQPWRFVQVLWTNSNTPISADDPDLGRVVRTKANAHKLANRVRERLEPIPGWPIYLLNDRGEGGYWLENIPPALKK